MMRWFMDNREEIARMANGSARMVKARYEQKDVWEALMNMYLSLE